MSKLGKTWDEEMVGESEVIEAGLSPRDFLSHSARASGHRALPTAIGPSRPLTEKQAEVRRAAEKKGGMVA